MSEGDVIGPVLISMASSQLFWVWLAGIFGGLWIIPDSIYERSFWYSVCSWTCLILAVACEGSGS